MNSENVEPTVDAFAAQFSRLKIAAIVGGVLGGLGGLCFVIAHVMWSENPELHGVVVFPFYCGLGLSGMVTGVALLFAPTEFFTSDRGKKCLAAIGTTSVTKARVAIVLGLLIGCAFMALIAAGALQMLGILEPPLRR